MKKSIKKLFASLLALALVVTGLFVAPVTADAAEDEFLVFIALSADAAESGDWGYQYFGPDATNNMGDVQAVTQTVKNGETATVSVTLPTEALYTWFVAPVIDSKGDVFAADSTFETTVKIDGKEVTPDLAAGDAFWYEETGAVGKEAAVRLAGGFNEWGTKYIAESPTGYTTIEYTITPHIMIAGDAAATEAVAGVDLNGVYHAYLGLQTPVYSFRNSFEDEMYGKATDFFSQITGWDADGNAINKGGVFTDAEIAGNGTYSVSVTDFDLTGDFDSQEFFNLLFVSTDIPNSGEIKVSDVKVIMDGKEVYTFDEGFQDPDTEDYVKVLAANLWNADLANGELFYYAIPTESIELQFTVSGFAYDNANAVIEEKVEEVAAEPVVAEPVVEETKSNTGLIVGIVVAAAVVVGGAAAVVISKKKKAK